MASVRAAVAVGPLQTELRSFDLPVTGPDDGLLTVEACGVCGTDWEFYRRDRGATLGPLILGHEIVGTVTSLGETAAERWAVAVGDRIVVEEFLPCGECRLCRQGDGRLCSATDSRGGMPYLRYGATPASVSPGLWGGFAEALYLHPRSIVHRIDDDLDAELATLFVPIANGFGWVGMSDGKAASSAVLIIGPGQHGLGCVIAAREAGFSPIIVAGLSADEPRLLGAIRLGADVTVAVDREDLVTQVREISDGRGVGLVIDVTPGAPEVIEDALAVASMRATIVLAGSKRGAPTTGFRNDAVVRNELTLRGVRGRKPDAVNRALEVIRSGHHRLEAFTSRRFGISDVDVALRQQGEAPERQVIHVTVVP